MNELVPTGVAVGGVAVADPNPGGHVAYESLAGLPHDVALAVSEDRDIAASFATAMKAKGAAPALIHEALRFYGQHVQQLNASQEADDEADARDARNTLRAEWGQMYSQNMAALRATFASLPPAVQQALENARLDDGCALFNSPAGLRWLFDLARTPVGSRPSAQSIAAELAEIEALMAKRGSRYWKGSDAERLQARYRQLIDMQAGR